LSTIIQQRQYDVKVIYIAPGEISKKLGKYPEVELISFKNICKNTVVKRHLEEWKLMRGILLKDL
jgi:F0F1-type ATP synthase alpha subunit